MRRLAAVAASAEVARWRISKAMGAPGLERLSWAHICWASIALAACASVAFDLAAGLLHLRFGAGDPVKAWVNIWVQIGIMVVAALVSYALRPRVQPPAPAERRAPEAVDGTSIREVFGTVWIDNPMELAWRALEPIEIRRKGGKK